MTYLNDAWKEVKDRPISELYNYLVTRTNEVKGVELFKYTRALAEVALAIYDFADHIKETGNAKGDTT